MGCCLGCESRRRWLRRLARHFGLRRGPRCGRRRLSACRRGRRWGGRPRCLRLARRRGRCGWPWRRIWPNIGKAQGFPKRLLDGWRSRADARLLGHGWPRSWFGWWWARCWCRLHWRRCSFRRIWRRLGWRLGCRTLANDPNGSLEGQALGFQEGRRHALAVTNDGGEYDGAVDLHVGARALASCSFCICENLGEVRIGRRHGAAGGRRLLLAEEARDVVAKAAEIDGIRDQHARRVLILGEGQQQVLERDRAVRLADRIVARTRERRDQPIGPRNPRLVRRRLSHLRSHSCGLSWGHYGENPLLTSASLICRASGPGRRPAAQHPPLRA